MAKLIQDDEVTLLQSISSIKEEKQEELHPPRYT
jgi:hypothetical protein